VLLQEQSCAAATHTLISQAFSYSLSIYTYNHTLFVHHVMHFSTTSSRITPPILPPRPPPLLPLPTIKLLLPQLNINRIMRLAHPLPKLAATAHARCIDLHPLLEVLGAHPARVQLAERAQERGCLGLQRRFGLLGVCGGDRVQEGPRRAAQLGDVRWAVFGERGWEGGALLFAAEGEERAHVVACSAAARYLLAGCYLGLWVVCARIAYCRLAHCAKEVLTACHLRRRRCRS
jgi:hypothetical protein